MHILIIEDDQRLADVLQRGLQEEGHVVDLRSDGLSGLRAAETGQYHVILLDVMLPGIDGFEVCRRLRQTGIHVPVLMLTARDSVDDTVQGLSAGADDYLRKPFAFRELLARIEALMRRQVQIPTSAQITRGSLVLDIERREVRRHDERIFLTNREFQIMSYLMNNPGRVLTRTMIEEFVWAHTYPGLSNTVDVHIGRLRSKIDVPGEPSPIETIRGVGYRLRVTRG